MRYLLVAAVSAALCGCATLDPTVDSSTSQFGLCSIANGIVWSTESKRAAVQEMERRGTLGTCIASQQAGAAMAAGMNAGMQPIQQKPLEYKPLPLIQPVQPPAQQAFWTGRSQIGQSVTGAIGTNCEYQYAGQKFWRMYQGGCPSSVDVR